MSKAEFEASEKKLARLVARLIWDENAASSPGNTGGAPVDPGAPESEQEVCNG